VPHRYNKNNNAVSNFTNAYYIYIWMYVYIIVYKHISRYRGFLPPRRPTTTTPSWLRKLAHSLAPPPFPPADYIPSELLNYIPAVSVTFYFVVYYTDMYYIFTPTRFYENIIIHHVVPARCACLCACVCVYCVLLLLLMLLLIQSIYRKLYTLFILVPPLYYIMFCIPIRRLIFIPIHIYTYM